MAALLWLVFGLPLAPVRGIVALAEVLLEQAEEEVRLKARKELEEIDEKVAAGELSEEEADEAAEQITQRLINSGIGG